MQVVHPRCCGLDVHKRSISACVVIREHGRMEKLERRFGTFTRDLEDLAEWLAQHQVTHLAMEATGVYWKPVRNVLEGRVDLMLVNPQHIKALTGKKYDRRDAAHLVTGCSTVCFRAVSSRQRRSGSCAILPGTVPVRCRKRRGLRAEFRRFWKRRISSWAT